ncbi:MAG: hypothetical protein HZB19_22140 [Chloroflexi bacterium]|nr:hypothetical protein [Chloroflexota bacterium]
MKFLEDFVLAIPYLFLKKIPYAWVFVVMFWAWPPVVSGIITAIILIGLFFMAVQQRAWEAMIRREYRVLYRDEPRAPLSYQIRNAALVCAASAAIGFLFDGRLGFTGLQWFLLLAGIMFLYKDALLLGASTVYLVTNKGIAIRYVPGHIDYRLFFRYDEILNVTRKDKIEKVPITWSVITPVRKVTRGLLLNPKSLDGFSRQIKEVLLVPTDMDEFRKHFPTSVVVN